MRHNLDILSTLESDIRHYSDKGDIIICGDINARTGCEQDAVCDDNNRFIPMPCDIINNYTDTRLRRSCDKISCQRGKDLIDLCISSNLKILNGRCLGDITGKFTSFQYNGNSVVDYGIVSDSFLAKVLFFHVHDPLPYLSDHAKITVQVGANFDENVVIDRDTTLVSKCYI